MASLNPPDQNNPLSSNGLDQNTSLSQRGMEITEDYLTTPGSNARDILDEQVGAIRAHLDTSLFSFAKMVFGYRDLTESFHGPICDFLGRWGTPNYQRLGVEVPRESFKTSLATRANALWQVSRSEGANATIAIFNAKEANSKKWLKAIREIIMSSKEYQRIYRELLPPGVAFWDDASMPRYWKWSDTELDLVRSWKGIPEASITALGIGGAATGRHWTHIIKDDIIGLEESKSEAMMQSARDWVDAARYLERPAEKGNDIFVYTRWHYGDVYRYVREKWHDEYRIYHRSALEEGEDGEEHSTFPEKWTTAELQKMRERDVYFFSAQMMCKPKAGREQSFDEEWLRYGMVDAREGEWTFKIDSANYDPTLSEIELEAGESAPIWVPLPWMAKTLLWDPAPSEQSDKNKEQRARNGLVLAGKDPWGRVFGLSAKGYREDPERMIRIAILTCIHWGCTRVAVEEVNFSKIYKHFARYLMRHEFKDYEITFIPQKEERRSKDARIMGLIPLFRAGFVYLNEPACRQMKLEYKEYPYRSTRDLIDALAMHKDVLFRPNLPEENLLLQQNLDRQNARRIPGQLDAVNWGG